MPLSVTLEHEARRAVALQQYAILDTARDPTFEDLAALAAHACDAPVAGIVFVDERRQWFKAGVGLPARELPRDGSLAEAVVAAGDLVVVEDFARREPPVADPLAQALASARFYAGMALATPGDDRIGALFVVDARARTLNPAQERSLRALARQVMTLLELRRQAVERRQRERMLQTIIDSEPECVKMVGPGGTIEMMNPAGLRMMEAVSPAQIAGKPLLSFIAPEHRQAVEALTRRVFRGGQGTLEFRATSLQGATRWFETHAVPLRDDRGAVTALLGITRDVTERKQADEALRQSEQSYRMLFEEASDGAFVGTRDGRIIDVNRAACALTGYSREELLARTVFDLVCPDDVPRLGSELACVSGVGVITREWHIRRRDGSSFIAEVKARELPDGRLQALARDITHRKEAEAAQARLAQAHRMETVGRLAGGVAHDFNNLLTVINATADVMLAELGDDHPMREDLRQIRAAGDRAATLTRQLLTLGRQQIVKPEVIGLNALIAGMEETLRRLVGEQIELRMDLAETPACVEADRGQMEQAILNLVLNARDAMPNGGALIVRTTELDLDEAFDAEFPPARPGRHVMLAVTDTGIGMDDATRRRVFEPFFTTKELGRGTGLGLSMVYGAVKQSAGTLRVESAPGRGTTIALYLPRVAEAPPTSQPESSPAPARGQETILIAEDEDALRSLASRILKGAGYAVLEAASGQEALGIIKSHDGAIDLLFTDVVMPRMSGGVLAAQATGLRPTMKVLFASGYTEDVVVREGALKDPRRFLAKPYTAPVLRAKVRDLLDS